MEVNAENDIKQSRSQTSTEKQLLKKMASVKVVHCNDSLSVRKTKSYRRHSSASVIQTPSRQGTPIDVEPTKSLQKTQSKDDIAKTKILSKLKKNIQKEQKKWNKIKENFDENYEKKYNKFRTRVYKGISIYFKGVIWHKLLIRQLSWYNNSADYITFLKSEENQYAEQIRKDVERTTNPKTLNHMNDPNKQRYLFNMLNAYSNFDRDIGYTQGMNEVAAFLLQFLNEKDALWCFISLNTGAAHGFRGMYLDGFPLLKFFNKIFKEQLKLKAHALCKHLDNICYDICIPSTRWFMCLFVQNFPLDLLLRIWDAIIFEGAHLVICAAIAIILYHKNEIIKCDIEEISNFFQIKIASHSYKLDILMQSVRDEFKDSGLKSSIDETIEKITPYRDNSLIDFNGIRINAMNFKFQTFARQDSVTQYDLINHGFTNPPENENVHLQAQDSPSHASPYSESSRDSYDLSSDDSYNKKKKDKKSEKIKHPVVKIEISDESGPSDDQRNLGFISEDELSDLSVENFDVFLESQYLQIPTRDRLIRNDFIPPNESREILLEDNKNPKIVLLPIVSDSNKQNQDPISSEPLQPSTLSKNQMACTSIRKATF